LIEETPDHQHLVLLYLPLRQIRILFLGQYFKKIENILKKDYDLT